MPGVLWIAAGAALWGTDTVFRRTLVSVYTPIQIVLYEHLIISIVVLPVLVRHRHHLSKISRQAWLAICAISWIGSALATVLFTAAVQSGSPTTAVLLQKMQPVFAIALARFMLGERWHRSFPVIVLVAVAGGYLISFGNGLFRPWESLETTAALLAIVAAAGWASATVFGRFVAPQIPFDLLTALRIVCALPVLLFVQRDLSAPLRSDILPLSFLALVPGFAALMLYYRGLRSTPASQATIAELAFPATSAVLNWVVLGVEANPIQVMGFAVVWIAIFYLQKMNFRAN